MKRVVVIGGGFAGLHAVRGLNGADCEITLIDRTNHTLFTPLLYQVATAALNEDDIATPLRKVLRHQKNVQILMDEVVGIDLSAKQVRCKAHSIPYDLLLIAIGVQSNYFAHPEWAPLAPSLKTLEDALKIRTQLIESFERAQAETDPLARKSWLTFVLAGGGPTGVEMSGAIAELMRECLTQGNSNVKADEVKVLLVEGSAHILNQFDVGLADASRAKLESLGVELKTGFHVNEVTPDGVKIGDEFVPARNVFWAAGVLCKGPKDWMAVETDRAGRLLVQPNLLVNGQSDVYAAGDAANITNPKGESLPGVAQVAMQSGDFVAKHIRARLAGQEVGVFAYKDLGNMATVGRAFAIAEIRGFKLKGFIGWVLWMFIHVLYVSTFRSRLSVSFRWFWAYFSRDRSATVLVERD